MSRRGLVYLIFIVCNNNSNVISDSYLVALLIYIPFNYYLSFTNYYYSL